MRIEQNEWGHIWTKKKNVFFCTLCRATKAPTERDAVECKGNNRITYREAEVLNLIGDGKSNAEIAEMLCLSESTVKFHKTNMFRKLKVTTTAQLLSLFYLGQIEMPAIDQQQKIALFTRGILDRIREHLRQQFPQEWNEIDSVDSELSARKIKSGERIVQSVSRRRRG